MNAIDRICKALLREAKSGTWNGTGSSAYIERCRFVDYRRGIIAIFSRDAGHHGSGWWKNADYERCFHLSLSFFDPETKCPRPRDVKTTRGWKSWSDVQAELAVERRMQEEIEGNR